MEWRLIGLEQASLSLRKPHQTRGMAPGERRYDWEHRVVSHCRCKSLSLAMFHAGKPSEASQGHQRRLSVFC